MRLALKGILGTTLLALSGAASAAITWDWSFNGGASESGSGTLTTNALSSGSYLITSLAGTWDGHTITGLELPGTLPLVPTNDNLLLSGSPQLDSHGLYFGVMGQPGENIFDFSGFPYEVQADNTTTAAFYGTFGAIQAPEIDASFAASGLALLVGGLLVLGGRQRQAVAA